MRDSQIIYSTDWIFKEIPTSHNYVLYKIFEEILLFTAVTIPIAVVAYLLVGNIGIITVIVSSILLLLLVVVYSIFMWKSISYTLETTRHVKVGKYFDVRSANIIIEKGILNRTVTVHSVECFRNCETNTSFLASMLGFGNIVISGDKRVELVGVEDPRQFIFIIQDLIDDYKGNLASGRYIPSGGLNQAR